MVPVSDDLDDALATLPAHLADTVELALPRFSRTFDTLARPSATIEPELAKDSRGEAAVAELASRNVAEGLAFERTLGQGGMGIVRLAVQRSLGRHVAVKTLRDNVRSEQARLRLLREAWITGALEHPNVVPVYDLGLDDAGNPVIVLKRIEGETWDALRTDAARMCEATGERTLERANLRVFLDVCQAVALAHARGIVHRDLKPENVMIGPHGEVYVVDWGIAVATRDDGSGRFPLAEQAREMAGTPAYMAPEMLGGGAPSRISERTDIYLLGAILHELATGRAPHDVGDMRAILSSILLSSPRLEGAPSEIAEVVRRAMRRDPAERYASVADLRRAVEQYVSHMASSELADEARASLAELERALAAGGEPETLRPELYRYFGACRFGFQEALRGWPGNEGARRDLASATTKMVRFELAAKSPSAAAGLLADLADPPADLVALVAAGREAEAAEKQRIAAMEREVDLVTGGRTRVFVASILGAWWSVSPLLIHLAERVRGPMTGAELIAGMLPTFGIAAVLTYWARESLFKTVVNRRMVGMVWGTLALTGVAVGAGLAAEVDAHRIGVSMILVWAVSAAVAAPMIGRWFLPTPIALSVAFVVAAWRPSLWPLVGAAGNFTFTANIALLWRDRVPWAKRGERKADEPDREES